ncbi:Ig-like domain-containing protein [Photobacterium sp. DA100]|uniref:Ig-like domain-containing protein n=1 Tax=Photobacterium sp. DA100 TaxID=3027472 RepID=UPI002478D98A|nr:Ig-like domain-containing protein [Photobacterium sp. DA100]WEM43738.1 Ig-like domain-containing protein [Photobacterium sp. DA100]
MTPSSAGNTAPIISGAPATSVNQDASYSFTPVASDLDNDDLTFSIDNQPSWASFNSASGQLSGTPTNDDVGTTSNIVIHVSDGVETDSLGPFSLEVVNVNDAPTISGTPATSVNQGASYSFTPVASDIDSDALTFGIDNLPAWASFNTASGQLSGTPSNDDVGTTANIVIRVSDGNETVSLAAFNLEVVNVNDAPVISGTPATSVNQDASYSFTPVASDIDNDALAFSIDNLPAWASFNTATGQLSGTPSNDDVGTTSNIVIHVSDGNESASLVAFNLEVVNVNDAPTISGTPATSVQQDASYSFTPVASDIDNDALTFGIDNLPVWASFNTASGVLSGTPSNDDVGTTSNIVITVSDGTETVSLVAFNLEVVNVNDVPTISGTPATSVQQDASYSFTPVASDIDNDDLTFSIDNLPSWASFNTASGLLSGTPSNDDVGTTANIVIHVSDGNESASLVAFNLEVVNVNDAPTISGTPATSVQQDASYSFTPVASDIDNDALTFGIDNLPVWASFNTASGVLSGTPSNDDVGTTSNIVIHVSDGNESASLVAFNLEVVNVNDAPTISGTPATSVQQDASYSFTPVASDIDNDALTFGIDNLPVWASFNTASGVLSGTPSNDDVGTTSNIVIHVSDGNETASLAAFNLEVVNVNDAPTISGTPATSVQQDASYSFTPVASDLDNDALTFGIDNQPAWASFNTATGLLSGTPSNDDVGTTSNIVIHVSDGNETASLAAFNLEVVNVNDAPTISGTPATSVQQDASYSFTPVASDLDNDALTFGIDNQPSWASFNTASGQLFGTPSNDDVGTTSNIVIHVSDGTETVSLAAFSLEVVNVNDAPTISGTPATSVNQDASYSFTPVASDIDNDDLTFSIDNLPVWASFNTGSGLLSGTPTNGDVGTTSNIVIHVSDGVETDSLGPFSLEVVNVNDAPTISGTPATSVQQDASYSFTPVASDIDNDDLTFSIDNLPAWASFNTATGQLSGTPSNDDVGTTSNIVIHVSDGIETDSLGPFSLEVVNVNDAPTISGTPATSVQQDASYSFTPVASDIDNDALTFGIDNLPVWASFNTASGLLSGTPTNDDVGTISNIVIHVSDGNETASLAAFNLEVVNVNDAPTISGIPATSVNQDASYSFTPVASDIDNDDLTFSIDNLPAWASFNTASGQLSGTPSNDDVGTTSNIVIHVSDGNETASLAAFNLEVVNVNDAPTISGTPATSVQQDASYSFTPVASDLDNDALTFGIDNQPAWASFNTATGLLSGTPSNDDVGTTSNIVIHVSDGNETASLAAFNLEVVNVNDAPTISGTPATSVNQDASYSFTPVASDLDNDALTFGIDNLPVWASFNTANGQLSGTPTNDDVGTTANIVIHVSDGTETVSLAAFSLEVVNVNDAPTISGAPATSVNQDASYSFTPVASDIDNDDLTFSIDNQPSWASFNTASGQLSGTPSNDDVGTTSNIVIHVSDGNETASLAAFNLEVVNVNDAPTISGTPATSVQQDASYSFTPVASDIDNDDLTFSIDNLPAWASFNTASGQLSGTPSNDDVGTTSNIVIHVSDGNETASLAAFNLEVVNVNDAPTISGTPATSVQQDASYSFTPVASDIDNDALTFGIDNLPVWASFNTASGVLSGTPSNDDVGTTSNIVIHVSDGNETASLAAFNLEVVNVNDAPTISGTPATSVQQDASYSFTPVASDLDNDALTFGIDNQPAWASFNTATGLLSGTPSNDDVGTTANIVITVSDGNETASLVAFNLEVVNVNDAPVSVDDIAETNEDESVLIDILSNDYDIDQNLVVSSVSIETAPEHGTAQFDTGTGKVTYQPENDFNGTDIFSYRVKDSDLSQSELATVTITVTPVNDAPVAAAFNEKTAEDNPLVLAVRIASSDSEEGTPAGDIEIVVHPEYGVATVVDSANIRYMPNDDYFGQDELTYRIYDEAGLASENAEIKILVGAINDRPVARDDEVTTFEDEPVDIAILSNDSDIEDGSGEAGFASSQITLIDQGSLHIGSVSVLADGKLRYVPDADANGTELISYSITDSDGYESLAATVTVTITPVNDSPVAIDNQAQLLEEGTLEINVLGNDYDVDEGDQLDVSSVEIVTMPQGGTVSVTPTGAIRYQAIENFFGDDLFSYQVKDLTGDVSNIAMVDLTVMPVNDVPIIVDDTITETYTEQNQFELDVLSNDVDVDGDELSIVAAQASVGTVTIENNKLNFVAPAGFTGNVEISYLVTDEHSELVSATVNLTIEGDVQLGTPVINEPDDVEVNATGLFTKVDLGIASAFDSVGNPLSVSLVDNRLYFPPGKNIAYWQTKDAQGNTAEASQRVMVHPLVSIEKDRVTAEGSRHQVKVHLNGASPSYPVVIPYTISGSVDNKDHDLEEGKVVIEDGVEGSITFSIAADGISEGDEELIITLDQSVNLGSKSVFHLLIKEDNIPPQLTATVSQSGQNRQLITNSADLVTIRTTVIDANVLDSHQYSWDTDEPLIINQSDNEEEFVFSPQSLLPGHYRISLTVMDNASVPALVKKDIYFEVVSQLASLGTEDSDGDLMPDSEEGFADSDDDGIPDYLDAINECNVLQERALESDSYLIEGNPGVCLRKGVSVAANASGGTQLFDDEVEQEFGSDTEATNIGGVFDFIAYGLPTPGQTYQVVFPQRLPIPANAVYRKYSEENGWFDFVIDSNNYLSSTAGEAGYCPPPGSELWVVGLKEGDWCVQLTIEDGGPNDDDGTVNGSIMDPGGVAAKASENVLPVAEPDIAIVGKNASVMIDVLANDSDVGGDTLSIVNASVNFGQAEIINGQLYYTAETGYLGEALIAYSITDSRGGTATATATVTVVNSQSPVAVADDAQAVTQETVLIDVLANDYDPDSDQLAILAASATNGKVVINSNQTLSYQSDAGFEGIDTISYQITDMFGLTSVANVKVTVRNVSSTYVKNSGGGSMGGVGIMMLMLLALCKWGASKSRSLIRMILLFMLPFSLQAQAGWYVEADIGMSKARDDLGSTQAEIINIEDDDLYWAVGAGYSITPDWDVTIRYIDQGKGAATLAGGLGLTDAEHQSVSRITPVLVQGFGIDTRYAFWRQHQVSLAGVVGAMFWQADIESLYQGKVITHDDDGVDPYLGLELSYAFTPQWLVSLAVNRYFIDANDVDSFSVKLKYQLPGF